MKPRIGSVTEALKRDARPPVVHNPFVKVPVAPIFYSEISKSRIPRQERDTHLRLSLLSFPWRPTAYDTLSVRLHTRRTQKSIRNQGKGQQPKWLQEAMRRSILTHRTPKAAEDEFIAALEEAVVKCNPTVICCSELAYPTRSGIPSARIKPKLRDLARKQDCLIIAGSAHDLRTSYNTSFVFYPGCPAEGDVYHKQVSATNARERVSTPSPRETRVFGWRGLDIGVLTCFDIVDMNAVAAVAKFDKHPGLLLIPSFSEMDDVLWQCTKEASVALNGMSVLVNAHSRQGEDNGIRAFDYGNDLVAAKVSGWTSESIRASLISVDIDDYTRRRKNREGEKRHWLCGGPPFSVLRQERK